MTIAYLISPTDAATVTADLHNLPRIRLTSRGNTAHAFIATLDDLTTWLNELGGYTLRDRTAGDLTTWTLRTHTEPRDDGSTTNIHAHVTVLDEEQVPDELTAALT